MRLNGKLTNRLLALGNADAAVKHAVGDKTGTEARAVSRVDRGAVAGIELKDVDHVVAAEAH